MSTRQRKDSTQEFRMWWERSKAPWTGRLFEKMNLRGSDEGEQRIQRLREEILTRPQGRTGKISICRARLITESYKKTEGEPAVIRKAKAIYHLFGDFPIWLSPNQLIIGNLAAEPNSVEIEPEFSTSWLTREVSLNGVRMSELEAIPIRRVDSRVLTEENKSILEGEIIPYWRGKDLEARVIRELKRSYPEEYFVCWYSNVCMPVFFIGMSHTVQDYASVLRKGLKNIKIEIESHLKQIASSGSKDVSDSKKRLNYEAMLICADGLIVYANRCADYAAKLAREENNQRRAAELLEIARICRKVPEYSAETWWEALQSWHFLHMSTTLAECGYSHSAGNFDQYMYSFLKRDLDEGKITKAQAQELLECLFIKFNERDQLTNYKGLREVKGVRTNDKINIGGQDAYGQDCTNELSYMLLEACAHVHLSEPNLAAKIHENISNDFLRKCLEVIRLGSGLPLLLNDKVIVPALLSMGVSLPEARNYADIGCQENATDPNMVEGADVYGHTNAGWFNLVKPVELALFDGINPMNQKQVGPKTGDPRSFRTMDDFVRAVRAQFQYAIKVNVMINNLIEHCFVKYFPTPYHNLMHPGPRKSGIDMNAGGCKYNWTGAIGVGVATAGDILSSINHSIYETKEVSWDELLKALQDNWEAYEELRKKCTEAPKYGEDNDKADKWVQKITNMFFDAYESHPTPRGGKFVCGLFSMGTYVTRGQETGATPDGRKRGEPLSDGISPSRYAKPLGPTATHNSASQIDTFRTLNGVTFNQRFSEKSLLSERELMKLVDLVKVYFDRGGQEVQYSVVNADVLKQAQKYPERYRDIVIRVGGYSAIFVDLPKEIQETFIMRVEQSI